MLYIITTESRKLRKKFKKFGLTDDTTTKDKGIVGSKRIENIFPYTKIKIHIFVFIFVKIAFLL